MSDIELVVKIPEELYEEYKGRPPMHGDAGIDMIAQAIANGKPLPKGHGDLIDRDYLLLDSYYINDYSGNEVNIVEVMTVKMADAIIEADKDQE